jgi:DNA-binding MarR family transcriptional regulator
MPQLKSKPRATAMSKPEFGAHGYVLDDQPGFLLRVALRRHTAVFTAKMIENLTPPQFSTLAKLREVGPCSQNHLGRLVHYDSATITGVVNRLRKHGLIKSYEDPLDRRRHAVDLTDKGRRIADEAIVAISQISSETFAPLSATERRTLVQLLNKVIAG